VETLEHSGRKPEGETIPFSIGNRDILALRHPPHFQAKPPILDRETSSPALSIAEIIRLGSLKNFSSGGGFFGNFMNEPISC